MTELSVLGQAIAEALALQGKTLTAEKKLGEIDANIQSLEERLAVLASVQENLKAAKVSRASVEAELTKLKADLLTRQTMLEKENVILPIGTRVNKSVRM